MHELFRRLYRARKAAAACLSPFAHLMVLVTFSMPLLAKPAGDLPKRLSTPSKAIYAQRTVLRIQTGQAARGVARDGVREEQGGQGGTAHP